MTKYSEYLIEYDLDENVVYVSGLIEDEFWEEFFVEEPDTDVESYAWGLHDGMKMFHDRTITVVNVTDIFNEEDNENTSP